jgi:hypothetical protein
VRHFSLHKFITISLCGVNGRFYFECFFKVGLAKQYVFPESALIDRDLFEKPWRGE